MVIETVPKKVNAPVPNKNQRRVCAFFRACAASKATTQNETTGKKPTRHPHRFVIFVYFRVLAIVMKVGQHC
jgi:hypothetical protein